MSSESKRYVEFIAGTLNQEFHSWLLANGEHWTARDDAASIRLARHHGLVSKQCFYNAQLLALAQSQLYLYAEGIALSVVPLEHAWLIDRKTGKVIDPTWVRSEADVEKRPVDYFGIAVPTPKLETHWRHTKHSGPVLPGIFERRKK